MYTICLLYINSTLASKIVKFNWYWYGN